MAGASMSESALADGDGMGSVPIITVRREGLQRLELPVDRLEARQCSQQTHCLAPNPHAGSSVMRSDISHLPAKNQRELEQIVRAIFEEFEDAHKLASGDRKAEIGRAHV